MATTWLPVATIGDGGTYKEIIEQAKSLIEQNKTLASTGKTLYEANKAFVLATTDPAFAALEAALNEVLNIITDLRSIGLYQLTVEPTSTKDESAKPATIGTLVASGEIDVPAYKQSTSGDIYPLGEPLDYDNNEKNVQGFDESGVPLTTKAPFFKQPDKNSGSIFNMSTGLYEMAPSTVLNIIEQALNDEGDVNRPIVSESAAMSALILMATAPSFSSYVQVINALSQLFRTVTFEKLTEKLEKILGPAEIKLYLKDVISFENGEKKAEYFKKGDIIIGDTSGKIGTITNVSENVPETIQGKPNTVKYALQTLTVAPESQFNSFSVGENVYLGYNEPFVLKDENGDPILDPEGKIIEGQYELQPKKTGNTKVGKVSDSLDDVVKSKRPDFVKTKGMADIVPVIDTGLSAIEGFVKGLLGTVQGYDKAFDEIIKFIDSKVEELQEVSNKLNDLLELFSIELPQAGLYILNIDSPTGGISGFVDQMKSAEGLPPSTNKYSYAIALIGTGTSIESVNIIGELFGNTK